MPLAEKPISSFFSGFSSGSGFYSGSSGFFQQTTNPSTSGSSYSSLSSLLSPLFSGVTQESSAPPPPPPPPPSTTNTSVKPVSLPIYSASSSSSSSTQCAPMTSDGNLLYILNSFNEYEILNEDQHKPTGASSLIQKPQEKKRFCVDIYDPSANMKFINRVVLANTITLPKQLQERVCEGCRKVIYEKPYQCRTCSLFFLCHTCCASGFVANNHLPTHQLEIKQAG